MTINDWQFERHHDPRMTYYRNTYRGSLRLLSGKPPKNKRVIVYCEQGIGDAIQMLRYVPRLLEHNEVTLHCDQSLHDLVKAQWSVSVLDKFDPNLPEHDYHVLSMDLPVIFPNIQFAPYFTIGKPLPEILDFPNPIGIAWEGNPDHPNNMTRSCPLKYFQSLKGSLFCLQKHTYVESLQEGCEQMEVNGWPIETMLDVANMVSSMKYIVTVDTAVMHLAGAMGAKVYGLIAKEGDPRWGTGERTNWYPSLTLLRQDTPGDWASLFQKITPELVEFGG